MEHDLSREEHSSGCGLSIDCSGRGLSREWLLDAGHEKQAVEDIGVQSRVTAVSTPSCSSGFTRVTPISGSRERCNWSNTLLPWLLGASALLVVTMISTWFWACLGLGTSLEPFAEQVTCPRTMVCGSVGEGEWREVVVVCCCGGIGEGEWREVVVVCLGIGLLHVMVGHLSSSV